MQIINLIQIGKLSSAEVLAPLIVLSVHSIYKIVEKYNIEGVSPIFYKPKSGRRKAYLTLEQEKELFISLEDKASKGKIIAADDIRLIVEKKVGHTISDDYLWDLFQRNGWKKKMPRPHHPKRSLEDQLEFKKNSPRIWSPPL